MCDYNALARKTASETKDPARELAPQAGGRAWAQLCRLGRRSLLRPGHDFTDGSRLDAAELHQGHYMQPVNFTRALAQMNRRPQHCSWCGGRLPDELVRQHALPHNHREEIHHHFHPVCWKTRLLAVAIVFGHLAPSIAAGPGKRLPTAKPRNGRRRSGSPLVTAYPKRQQ